MAAFDPLSPEVVYALKGNIAYPLVGASTGALQTLAQNRYADAFNPSGATVTIPTSAFTVVKQ